MRFSFSEEQLALRDALRDLLAKECTPAHLRDAWVNETGRIPGLWEQLDAMGIVGLIVPEAAGGLGLTFVDLVLLLEETGRHAVPEPIVETAAYGVPLLGRADVTQAWMDAEAYRLYTLSDVTGIVEGRSPGARSSLNKIWWSELDVRLHEAALRILGPLGELEGEASLAVDAGAWMKGYQFSLSGPIYAGTNEIQRNVIAERVLGLPRK